MEDFLAETQEIEDKKLRDEIIRFVINSSEEENSKLAIFISGMKAQKCIMSDNYKNIHSA